MNGRRNVRSVLGMMLAAIAIIGCVVIGAVSCTSKWWKELPTDANTFDYSKWTLDFSDDFDGNVLDAAKWKVNTFESNNNVRRAGYYTDSSDVIFVENSNLVIRTKYKEASEPGAKGTGWHTSWVESSVESKPDIAGDDYEGYSTTYGYIETRCIVPPSVGIWSAFWMMPDGAKGMTSEDVIGTGSDGIEIDIMESPYMYMKGEKSLVTHVLHGDGYAGNLTSDKSPTYRVPYMYSTYHTYGVEWNETEYIFYVDGIETWRSSHAGKDGGKLGVSNVNEFLILSVEVAGMQGEDGKMIPGKVLNDKGETEDFWCGNPDSNDKTKNYDFIIDYVKVYKAKQ